MALKIGDQLKAYRKSKGLTTKQLAEKAMVAQSSISDIENNKISPSIDTLNRLLKALDLSFSDFFSNDVHFSADLLQLIETAKTLHPEERQKLNDFLKSIKRNGAE